MADPAATSAPVTGLVATVEYTVAVVARYSDGGRGCLRCRPVGTPSALSSAPGQPQGLTVAVDPAGRAQASFRPTDPVAALVSWDAPPDGEGVLFSEIQWRHSARFLRHRQTAPRPARARPASAVVEPGRAPMTLRLRHWNADGPGPWIEKAGLVSGFRARPAIQRSAGPLRRKTLEVIWAAPAVRRWQSRSSSTSSSTAPARRAPGVTAQVGAPALWASLTGLTNGTLYEVRLSARNAAGTSLPTATLTGAPVMLPSEPLNLEMTSFRNRLEVSLGCTRERRRLPHH